jgi:hypothetical protein
MKEKIHKKIKLATAALAVSASIMTAVVLNIDHFKNTLQQTISTHAAETTPQPSGNIIARGEDGVPWELYENGYLLFKPVAGKDTLKNNPYNAASWKQNHGSKIKYVGFSDKVYAPSNSSYLFSPAKYNFLPAFIDASKIDTSKVTNMSWMFYDARGLTTLDIENWNTSNVTMMYQTFGDASNITTLNIGNWDTRNVTRMDYMFSGASSLKTIKVNNWNTSNVTSMYRMFGNTNALTTLDVENWNTSNVTNMGDMFNGASSLVTLNVSNWNTSNVTKMGAMFSRASSLTSLDVGNWNTGKVTDMGSMFSGASSLITLNADNWNTSKVTDMNRMFSGTSSLTTLNIGRWDTHNVTQMYEMFNGASRLTTLDLGRWDTRNVVYMISMFWDARELTSIDLSGWDTSHVAEVRDMFNGATKLKEIKIGEKFKAEGIRSISTQHAYGNQYTDKWHKLNDEAHPYTVSDWATTYAANPTESAGTWVREQVKDTTITFHDQGTPPTVIKQGSPMITKFPDPTNIKPSQRFKGWSRTTDGDVITPDSIQPGENVTLYPRWEPVSNTSTTTEKIAITTEYRSDNSLDYGKRNETPGREGEKQVTTTYTVTPITGELTNPVKTEVITTPMQPKIVTIGTKPTDQVTEIPSPKRYVKDPDRRKGDPDIIEKGTPGSITTTTTYTVNPNDGTVTSNTGTPVRKDPTPTIIKVAAKDEIEVIKKPSPIIYEKDPNRARNTPDEKTEGTPGSITTVTSYDVDESNGHTTTRVGTPVTKEPTPTIIRIGSKDHTVNTPIPPKVRYEKDPNRERNTPDEKIVGNPGNSAVTTVYTVNPKDGTVTETQQPPVITPPGTTIIRIGAKDHTDVKVIKPKVIYEKDTNRDRGEPDIKKEGTPGKETTVTTYDVDPNDGTVTSHVGTPTKVDSTPTIIKIAARDKVEMIHKNGSDPIRRTTRYDVDPKTGSVTESYKDELPATGTFGTIITSISATTLVAFSVLLKRFKKTR